MRKSVKAKEFAIEIIELLESEFKNIDSNKAMEVLEEASKQIKFTDMVKLNQGDLFDLMVDTAIELGLS